MNQLAPIGAPYGDVVGRDIVALLSLFRLSLANEKILQAEIEQVLGGKYPDARREVHLGPRDIVDFMVGDVAIEVKIKGGRRDIFRQLERYCTYYAVGSIVLATNVPMSLPPTINGKPTYIANLSRGWL